jgi:hypothetical protein
LSGLRHEPASIQKHFILVFLTWIYREYLKQNYPSFSATHVFIDNKAEFS